MKRPNIGFIFYNRIQSNEGLDAVPGKEERHSEEHIKARLLTVLF